jgi:hypothetical protein
MTTNTLHPLAADYLARLRRAGRRLPADRLRELVTEIEGHLSEAIPPAATDAEALTVLDKLGDPETILAAELPSSEITQDSRGTREWAAIVLLLFGGFVVGVGWLAGLILLWSSRAWTTRDKWIGTLVLPGGLAGVWIVFVIAAGTGTAEVCSQYGDGARHCTSGASTGSQVLAIAAVAFAALTPFVTAFYLARRAR